MLLEFRNSYFRGTVGSVHPGGCCYRAHSEGCCAAGCCGLLISDKDDQPVMTCKFAILPN